MENESFTPDGMAHNAQKAAENMQKSAADTANAYTHSAKATGERMFEMNTAMMSMFQDNMQSYMRHMQQLAGVKSWPEFAELQSQFLQHQLQVMSENADKMRNHFTAIMTDSVKPLAENAQSTADRFRSHNS